jgi:DNA-binding NarL/FixJ family response regulator
MLIGQHRFALCAPLRNFRFGATLKLIRKRFESLSPRQREVCLLLVDGLTNTEIAEHLGLTVHTVKAHRAEVMRRMEAHTFADLVSKIQCLKLASLGAERSGPLRILVVEDDPWYRVYLTDRLNERGFTAVGVPDGAGLDVAWAEAPADIVILDLELGADKEDGIAIAARLLKISACGVIMVTAHGEEDERLKGLSIGADAYFSKPVNIDELALTITNLQRRLR